LAEGGAALPGSGQEADALSLGQLEPRRQLHAAPGICERVGDVARYRESIGGGAQQIEGAAQEPFAGNSSSVVEVDGVGEGKAGQEVAGVGVGSCGQLLNRQLV